MRIVLLAAAAVMIGFSSLAQSPALDKFYEKHKDFGFSADASAAIDPNSMLMSFMSNKDSFKKDEWLKKVKQVKLMFFEAEKSPAAEEWKELSESLHREHYEDLMMIRKENNRIQVLSADGKAGMRVLVFVGSGQGENGFLLALKGLFTDKDLTQLKISMDDKKGAN